jgi:UDP-N-acetyl-D-mannosaminuronic acid dehydrogenase
VKKKFEYPLLELEEAVRGSDCIILVTDHDSFKDLHPEGLGPLMRHKHVIDTRNILDQERWEQAGFVYRLLGSGVR